MNNKFEALGVKPADILLPKAGTDMSRWAVVACDQFTSQPEYWAEVDSIAGEAPSTLRLILPESQLGDPDVESHIAGINKAMADYLARDIFTTHPDSIIYIERTQSDGAVRKGLVAAVDLEKYDYTPGSGSLIRATEGTVLERIPPRVRVRKDAPIELPHVMLLIDDPKKTCVEPIAKETDGMEQVYDFELMMRGGYLKGWKLTGAQIDGLADALEVLTGAEAMEEKYGLGGAAPLLFAVGDGNHSLATAKTCYENWKKITPESEWASLPARYALVEIENLHDDALQFEAIHRVVFGVEPEKLLEAFKSFYPGAHEGEGEGHTVAYTWAGGKGCITVPSPKVQLAVGTLQNFLDAYLKEHGGEVDYIHGEAVTDELGAKSGNIGFKLPAMGKDQLFKTVIADGVLPRKTFSMGHAEDKRYYVEGRKIR
ncbi:MAG: DUF1015 domain-containing protein [Oscillospiraceae bacterium]|nr:DUF1015 domain-containing protein [Oscillospiraceae bacterium]